jgi:hypothetical protein
MDKKMMYAIVIAAVVLILAGGVWWYLSAQPANQQANTANNNASQTATTATVEGSQDTSGEAAPVAPLSYAAALNQYKDKRFQFSMSQDAYCSVVPNVAVFKKGTAAMFDNRSNKIVSFSLDGKRYTIKAYGFRVITLTTTAKLPHAMSIDCGTGQNNGTITLEQ